MIDDILGKRPKKHIKDLNIVPILDMLTTVIFFLLMSTSFMEYTKLTLPPASTVSVVRSESKAIPLTPKVIVLPSNGQYLVRLSWQGDKPGQSETTAPEEQVITKVKDLLQKFKEANPGEKTLQVSLEKSVKYQILISIMDAARDLVPDVVLMSYAEATRP